ncbi:unnamed protein product, partial [marine sediment metagenome]
MDVLPEAGPVLVAVLKKGALHDEDVGLAHHIGPFESCELDVAEVADQRDMDSPSDLL